MYVAQSQGKKSNLLMLTTAIPDGKTLHVSGILHLFLYTLLVTLNIINARVTCIRISVTCIHTFSLQFLCERKFQIHRLC